MRISFVTVVVVWATMADAFSGPRGTVPSATTSTSTSELQSSSSSRYPSPSTMHQHVTLLAGRYSRRYVEDDDGRERAAANRPTLPQIESLGVPVQPSKPKIVVLGASGRIGSLVVKRLMEMSELDATIVAFVRDYDKACRVLYDDPFVTVRGKRRGPQLQIVVGDLVPDEELPGYQDEDDEMWANAAQSAAGFYKNDVKDHGNQDKLDGIDVNEALQDAVRGCTTIISCVGAVRRTNLWTDFISRPLLRLFRHDVSGWCGDKRHPYYVHYASTRKVVGLAEREQLRREAIAEALAADGMEDEAEQIPRIRIVRISDLCVTQKPWAFVPVLTNALHSMVFRYQDMTERLLEESYLLDSVILRPGDLVDDERDVNTTSLHVDPSGKVPGPARVGREDVASLAVAASLFHASNATNANHWGEIDTSTPLRPPLHLKLGVRWTGEHLDPYPAQGRMSDGLPDAQRCMNRVLKDCRERSKRQRRKELRRTRQNVPDSIVRFVKSQRRRNIKPYGVCVALPIYLFLGLLAKNLVVYVSGIERMTPLFASVGEAASGLYLALVPLIQKLLRWIPKRTGKNFISF